jgi:hypothetical protein
MLYSRSVYQGGDVACDESPLQRLFECPPQNGMEVLNRAGGKPFRQLIVDELLNVRGASFSR